MNHSRCRKELSAQGLLNLTRGSFERLPDLKKSRGITLADTLMSGLAMFGLKYPSLLQFDNARNEEAVKHNLNTLYGIKRAPCDTYLRERLDELDPEKVFRKTYKRLFAAMQRGKGLEGFQVLGDYLLVSADGTGVFSSHEVHCEHCCEKHHRDGSVTYYHQLLAAMVVHPNCREVIPLMPEPIIKSDGASKNDCERNAAKRLFSAIRRDHPHLKLLVVEDGLASNGPHIKHLEGLNMAYLLGAKSSDHSFLFEWVEKTKTTKAVEIGDDKTGITHQFRYLNGAPLNETHFELEVNFLEYWEHSPNGKVQHFSWVTDIVIDEANLMELMRAGRARWKIENETFNTLKNRIRCIKDVLSNQL